MYTSGDYEPADYYAPGQGIRALLEGLASFGWQPVEENGVPIALHRGASKVTLEPGGQVELSGAPHRNVHQVRQETLDWHAELRQVVTDLGLRFLAIGHQPKHRREDLPWMPKQRYQIMRNLMPRQGTMGLDMMQATSSLQVTLDFSSEADMVKKFRVALALQPLATALFAYSPLSQGRSSGFLSLRDHIWHDTDPQRCGSLPFVFAEGMGFERYVDYLLDVPMYFLIRDGKYIDTKGQSFAQFLSDGLPALPAERPRLSDWILHLTTVFPQVRLTRYLEMRGADSGEIRSRVPALAALWAGLLYDVEALDTAWQQVSTWTADERRQLETQVVRQGFQTPFRDGCLLDLCRWMVDLSRQGLQRRDIVDQQGRDESVYLNPLQEVLDAGRTFAEDLLDRFHGQWKGNIDDALSDLCEETLN